ncbi:uncharacterized protein LOC113203825 isoform X5 [Frankliniella occidentalis]|uniref:Uncharacterized protein LOC113203825 isoform X5 n=1 Tax=Frankliniella occidentalis TaxID=133901 RepID=A0A9C6X877_FRAOC|nr:uncharacterized protein LOC113203825 isoform X5 [Frankliniella occidentalis]
MKQRQVVGWALLALMGCSAVLPGLALPHAAQHPPLHQLQHRQYPVYQHQQQQQLQQPQPQAEARKYAEKPNAMKKVPIDNDLDDIQTNQISDGFSWSSMLSMIMQMLFNGGAQAGPSKSEGLDDDNMAPASPWAQVLQVGLKILSHFLGGGAAAGDGIDKVDNSSPMQGIIAAVLSTVLGSKDPDQVATMAKQAGEFINIVVNLLDALKTSFSHRAIAARSIGKKDSVSDAAVAGISVLKGYVRTYKTSDDNCMQKFLCEANRECAADQQGSSAIYCQLGSYAASFFLQRSTATPFDMYYEAGRRGRSQADCQQLYLQCNEV